MAFLLIISRAYSIPLPTTPAVDNWSIVKNSPLFSLSAEFDCKKGDVVDAKVIRTGRFCPRYYYDLYDSADGFQARGITRAFSWGFFFPWAMEIDVWDGNVYVGKIAGKFFTKARAKFGFHDGHGNESAVAYLNTESSEFVIVSPQNEASVLADLKGKAYGDVSVWEMNFITSLQVDPRILKIFAAFVADYHSEFLPPPKEINHYYFFNNNIGNY